MVSIYHNVTIRHFLNGFLGSIVSGFFVQLIGGPLGEEPAYRGFSLPYMQKEHGVIKAGLITGVVWGM
ncbi:MAG: CPBP family intramembrane metalloprotease [Lachnospiraceae bacterium]|nr:CPBP family intramembrane metalloprotease [Lachnospiraceae bacterium]